MSLWKYSGLLVACLCAFAASAQQSDGQNASAQVPASDGQDSPGKQAQADSDGRPKPVCKTMVVTGSRFRQRVCNTPEQWEQIELASRNKMREFDSQPVQHTEE